MAYINISMKEFVTLIEKNANMNRERIRAITVINDNQLELTVGIAQFLPTIKVILVYNVFQKGKMHFNVISNGGIKMLMGLITEMSNKSTNNFISVDKNSIAIEINKLLSSKFQGINVKDMSIVGEQIYITIDIK